MKIIETAIPDVLILEPTVHGDDRGYFMETFRSSLFEDRGLPTSFVQDNQSRSAQGTLRGLHYQLQFPQGKLARIVSGEVFDVAVDMRKNSEYFGQSVGVILSGENKRQLWIPPGFAHGFYVLSDTAELLYKCTDYYHPEDDNCLLWNDEALQIDWPLLNDSPLLSEKDSKGISLSEAPVYP
ncbi:MAG: dTDP-4-dehydrorhamnose 3,5-epimerase [Gammaproteobacteria bacterium]|jgi:dTDP-4-dehydrorhamnose 3,5-epimerase|nr:dTDP-4-dehydrorhamnose 3,5-epimerase [Gammaproteobacteria bacterium]MBT3860327.1 dTDP-4-dehydrorhamnose 3,5-epimerase [Gammaproteobacteria bacterium]MBT3987298.1 dTDP-4-dehydrorhamnose 3,5-epimerase [Gammaproteobacteria bacterium]MBT4256807.1 dTDP-4-dehydrorhamnose 3,5-epimerase [Gammaproteobacteria bacterium]MBT4581262.1 dTDP-4-dehydrorhamnose 3,5-epimerase [Gammaproteobacteria bacterium]